MKKCPVIKKNSIVQGNSLDLLKCLDNESVDLVVTSPPYADKRKKFYNSIHPDNYPEWFAPFAKEINRVLKPTGSFLFNIKEHVVNGERHTYVHDTIKKIKEQGFRWNETYLWNKTNPFPRKPIYRFKDGFEHVYHFTKQKKFKFRPERVKIKGMPGRCEALKRTIKNGTERYTNDVGYNVKYEHFLDHCEMTFPTNVLTLSTNRKHNHPAAFPEKLPEFFIKAMSDEGDVVLDPFAGSGTTVAVAKRECRRGIGFDMKKEYVDIANQRIDRVEDC